MLCSLMYNDSGRERSSPWLSFNSSWAIGGFIYAKVHIFKVQIRTLIVTNASRVRESKAVPEIDMENSVEKAAYRFFHLETISPLGSGTLFLQGEDGWALWRRVWHSWKSPGWLARLRLSCCSPDYWLCSLGQATLLLHGSVSTSVKWQW